MSALDDSRSELTRDLRLTGWQVRDELRSFWRNRARGVFTFVFPLLFLFIFASLDKGGHLKPQGGISYDDFLVPGILAYPLASAFPVKALANALQYAFDPLHHGAGFDGSALLTLGIWTVIGVWLMLRFLRVPLRDHVA